jgi:hypothetical protein
MGQSVLQNELKRNATKVASREKLAQTLMARRIFALHFRHYVIKVNYVIVNLA